MSRAPHPATPPAAPAAKALPDVSRAVGAARADSMGWHIQRLAGVLDRAMAGRLAPHGLTVQQFALVMTALETDGLSQAELCARFAAPAYAITRALDQLQAAGFLERRVDPVSRRQNTVHATARAHALVPAFLAIIAEVNAALVEALPAEDAERLRVLLQAVLGRNGLACG